MRGFPGSPGMAGAPGSAGERGITGERGETGKDVSLNIFCQINSELINCGFLTRLPKLFMYNTHSCIMRTPKFGQWISDKKMYLICNAYFRICSS